MAINLPLIVRSLAEGFAVAIAAYIIPYRKLDISNIIVLGLSATAVFVVLDMFAPLISPSARQGAGFGLGLNQIGWGAEPFEDCQFYCRANPSKCQSRSSACCKRGGSGSTEDKPTACPDCEEDPSTVDDCKYSATEAISRPMNVQETNCPVNSNTNEYKLMRGFNSSYYLQPGYSEAVKPYSTKNLSPVCTESNNPLDRFNFKKVDSCSE